LVFCRQLWRWWGFPIFIDSEGEEQWDLQK